MGNEKFIIMVFPPQDIYHILDRNKNILLAKFCFSQDGHRMILIRNVEFPRMEYSKIGGVMTNPMFSPMYSLLIGIRGEI